MEEEITLSLNPHEDRIIGVVGNQLYFKNEYENYVLIVKRKDYLKLLNSYIDSKKDFCKRYNHFCGVCGDFYITKYETFKEGFKINEMIEVEDDGENEGIDFIEVEYPLYKAITFDNHCDMEHG